MRNIWQVVVLSVLLVASLGCPSGGGPKELADSNELTGAELTITVLAPAEPNGRQRFQTADIFIDGKLTMSLGGGSMDNSIWLREGSHTLRVESKGMKPEKREIGILAQGTQSILIEMAEE